jgi:hypothetical protein
MRVNNDLFRICGVVDKKEFAWVPFTDHKIVDYRIEPPIYRLFVEVQGTVLEFEHPIDQGLDYLRNKIDEHLNQKKEQRSKVRMVFRTSANH